jgi:hypothetical protein
MDPDLFDEYDGATHAEFCFEVGVFSHPLLDCEQICGKYAGLNPCGLQPHPASLCSCSITHHQRPALVPLVVLSTPPLSLVVFQGTTILRLFLSRLIISEHRCQHPSLL